MIMCNLIKNSLNSIKKFTVLDFAVFKIYLVFIGILFGVYFSAFFLKYIGIVWIVAVVTLVITLTQLVRYNCKRKD